MFLCQAGREFSISVIAPIPVYIVAVVPVIMIVPVEVTIKIIMIMQADNDVNTQLRIVNQVMIMKFITITVGRGVRRWTIAWIMVMGRVNSASRERQDGTDHNCLSQISA